MNHRHNEPDDITTCVNWVIILTIVSGVLLLWFTGRLSEIRL